MAGEPVEVGQYVSLARKALVNDPYLANAAIIGELTKPVSYTHLTLPTKA